MFPSIFCLTRTRFRHVITRNTFSSRLLRTFQYPVPLVQYHKTLSISLTKSRLNIAALEFRSFLFGFLFVLIL
jgi:hypothetical protein